MDPLRSHHVQLFATAALASLTTAGLISAYNAYSKRERRKNLNEDILRSLNSSIQDDNDVKLPPETAARIERILSNNNAPYDEDLVREQLARNYAFFGDESMDKIRGATVVVVGCGGVGSWAAVMLVRSGVSKIRLVDFDYVTLSSLNRHATAGLKDVGTPKVTCIEKALKDISRWVEVDSRIELWKKEDGGKLLEGADWVIDAIDNITTKVDLLACCHKNSIKVFSSMGSGAKSDPTRIQIADISHTLCDPLARSVRHRLRLLGVSSGIPVVYSNEVPGDVKLLPLPEEEFQKGNVKELGVLEDFRVRILPVLGPLPCIFGLNIATYILCELAGKPISNPLAIKNRRKVYERLLRDFLHRESKITGVLLNKLPLDENDVSFIFEDLHRNGRSIVPPHQIPSKPVLIRWDPSKPVTVGNSVVMDEAEAGKHLVEIFGIPTGEPGEIPQERKSLQEVWGPEADRVVQRRQREIEMRERWIM